MAREVTLGYVTETIHAAEYLLDLGITEFMMFSPNVVKGMLRSRSQLEAIMEGKVNLSMGDPPTDEEREVEREIRVRRNVVEGLYGELDRLLTKVRERTGIIQPEIDPYSFNDFEMNLSGHEDRGMNAERTLARLNDEDREISESAVELGTRYFAALGHDSKQAETIFGALRHMTYVTEARVRAAARDNVPKHELESIRALDNILGRLFYKVHKVHGKVSR